MKKLMLPSWVALFVVLGASCSVLDEQLSSERGRLQIILENLPPAVDAGVLVRGPNSSEEKIAFETTLTNLPTGNYSVVALSVEDGGVTYTPDQEVARVTIVADKTEVVTVTYSRQR